MIVKGTPVSMCFHGQSPRSVSPRGETARRAQWALHGEYERSLVSCGQYNKGQGTNDLQSVTALAHSAPLTALSAPRETYEC